MNKVLITGSAGYIGRHLVNLVRDYSYVEGLDKSGCGDCYQHVLDIRKPFAIDKEYDTVIHLAALCNVSQSTKAPIDYYETNVLGTLNVLKGLKYKNFILASTGSAVGLASPYALSKKAAEEIVTEYCTANNKSYTLFRFYNVTGTAGFPPTNPDGLFSSLIRAKDTGKFYIYGKDYPTQDGTAVRDYVHVNEICYSILKAIESPSNKIENLGHGIGHTVLQMANIFQDTNGCEFEIEYKPRRDGDMAISVLDNVSPYMTKIYEMKDLLKI
jgi:UDP-glucose 4-epimerase